ncbi:MAG TPA: efflux RND transporter periplasmic adaptor subunit [Candidatus Cloacimonadota bacterium]|nr:efflux RND transporter periplasmic adaptor subunit [Candidatus Cloacimonadota bacterium]
MIRKYLWIIVPLVVIIGAWLVLKKGKTAETPTRGGQAGVAVVTAFSEPRDLEETGIFTGNLLPRSSYIVAPKISGQLSRLHVNIGQIVGKGQLLAELDDRLIRQELEKAKAAVEIAEANLEQSSNALLLATEELERNRMLLQRSFISQTEFDAINARFIAEKSKSNIAQASLNSAIAAQNSAQLQLSFTRITADWADSATHRVIGERFADEGSQLTAGNPILSLMDISSVIARVDVIEKDYQRIRIGQPARLKLDSYPGEIFQGKVLRIAPMLKENTRQATVEIDIPNPGTRLKPGMFARVEIDYQIRRQVNAVPTTAITKRDGIEGVFVVDQDDRTVQFVAVQTGIKNLDYVEIVSPEINSEVVTLGHDLLEDGRKISTEQDLKVDKK